MYLSLCLFVCIHFGGSVGGYVGLCLSVSILCVCVLVFVYLLACLCVYVCIIVFMCVDIPTGMLCLRVCSCLHYVCLYGLVCVFAYSFASALVDFGSW